jgi:hypothetical protein
MGMCQEYVVYVGFVHWEFATFVGVVALLHAVVDEDGFTAGLQVGAASGYLVVGADEG